MKHVMTFCTAALMTAAASAGAQTPAARAPQTDQTVAVSRGARLAVENFAGEIEVRAWDRDAVRVQARHSSRVKIDIRTTETGLTVRGSGGGTGSIDYEINAPSWMPVRVDGQFNFVSIEGLQSEVAVETVRGDIVIKGGSGSISAKSIQGEVTIDGARGRINASSVNESIEITGASGDIVAETTNGSITMTKVDAKSVDGSTVNGDIVYDGSIADRAQYRFVTHNGDITVAVPPTSNATFSVRTYNGEFSPSLPVKGTGEPKRGKRATYVLGTGSAEVEMESFGGSIRLRGPGMPVSPKSKTKDKDN